MKFRVHSRIEEISAAQWNRLVLDNHPFTRHEFLQAMERHHCVGERFGWLPRHAALYDDNGELLAAMPLYEKHNSYGEFVFDHAWADAYHRNGLPYYPKLVSAVPYTPACGQRLLVRSDRQAELFPLLLDQVLQLTRRLECSSFHCLFPLPVEQCFLSQQLISRHDCQFHWHNRNYVDFEDFLSRLNAKKRKNIRQERRRAAASGVVIRRLDGHTASEQDWNDFNRFYAQTFRNKWGMATFNYPFFRELGQCMPDHIFLVLADLDGRSIAGALMYRSDNTLYGRHWGCTVQVDALHFEVCYYQGIEYCIEQGLERFEPGAQGEHKMARGFLPTRTESSHWIEDERFREAIARFVRNEHVAIAEYIETLHASSPYRSEPAQ